MTQPTQPGPPPEPTPGAALDPTPEPVIDPAPGPASDRATGSAPEPERALSPEPAPEPATDPASAPDTVPEPTAPPVRPREPEPTSPSSWPHEQPTAALPAWPHEPAARSPEQASVPTSPWSSEQGPVPVSAWSGHQDPLPPSAWSQEQLPAEPLPPPPPPAPRDPPAVALANASFLGAGYLVLGRKWLAVATGLVTITLIAVLVSTVRSVWMEIAVLVWWAAMIAHGWYLARGRREAVPPAGARKQRLVALAVTLPVLLVVGLLRYDAARIEQDVTAARGEGDCARALTALDRLWAGHRVVDAPLTARGDTTVEACDRLRNARDRLDTALTGDTDALSAGFTGLTSVLADLPGHEKMVDTALDGFLDRLPISTACDTRKITDWLRDREAGGNGLDRAADVVPGIAPAAILQCADDLMATDDWEQARAAYEQLLDEYPDHELKGKAEEGVRKATLAIELANVRRLLSAPHTTVQPRYCSTPAPYSGAPAYRAQNPNRALVFGNPAYSGKLPAEWLAADAAEAVLVVCAGETEFGTPVATCPYEADRVLGGRKDVTFHKIAIPVRVYELRTGQLVTDTRVEITGGSCPAILSYTTISTIDLGPPSQVHVTAADSDVHAAFNALINP